MFHVKRSTASPTSLTFSLRSLNDRTSYRAQQSRTFGRGTYWIPRNSSALLRTRRVGSTLGPARDFPASSLPRSIPRESPWSRVAAFASTSSCERPKLSPCRALLKYCAALSSDWTCHPKMSSAHGLLRLWTGCSASANDSPHRGLVGSYRKAEQHSRNWKQPVLRGRVCSTWNQV